MMKKRALLPSLLALGALGLVACGGGDDDETSVASEIETTVESHGEAIRPQVYAGGCPSDDPILRLEVVEGDVPCRVAHRVMQDYGETILRTPPPVAVGDWRCSGQPDRPLVCEKNPGETVTARYGHTSGPPTLSSEQEVERVANSWAVLFGDGPHCNRYMGQPVCERISCERVGNVPIENCTPLSAAFVSSFADATVQEIAVKGHQASVKFSNGGVVLLSGGWDHHYGGPAWTIGKVGENAGREFFD
jgi:hypothetical protein